MKLPEAITGQKVIAVARSQDADTVAVLLDALQRGGVSVLEVTVEAESGFAAMSAVAGGDATIGAGTITTVAQAERAVDAGAEFLVTPHLDETLLDWSQRNGVPLIPGGLTPTEIASAWSHGPPAVKLFPASLGGPGYLRSLLGPYPGLRLIPTGGVDATNVAEYLAAGALAVGVGGWLTSHDDPSVVAERAALLRSQVV